jgi:peptidyl-prolyl cis-trans isomerase SDCCAG10
LAKQEALYGQHTLFGKLVGDSVYVFSDIGEVEVDKNDRPIGDFPPVILETVVLENPFPDIVPRDRKPPFEQGKKSEHRPVLEAKPKISAKKTKVLSFADEEEEEIGESVPVTIRSAHDLGGSLSSTAFEPKSAKKDEKISTQNDTKTSDLESLMRPNVPASIPKAESAPPSNAIQSEIVRLQAMIKAAESRPQPVATVKPVEKKKHAEEAEDQQIVKKLREWGSLVHKSKTEELTGKEAVSPKAAKKETLFALISSAEGGSVGGSDWLKSAGTLKFSIDSKNAFSR